MSKADEVIADIKARPEKHRHAFQDLQQCCLIDGVLDMRVMNAHQEHALLGSNGGTACDVTEGPCACGAWH